MKEYIEREAARGLLENALEDDWETDYALDRLSEIPAANVREVVRGKWLPIVDANEDGSPYQSGVYCSECGHCDVSEYNYCPNCGADMRGEQDG